MKDKYIEFTFILFGLLIFFVTIYGIMLTYKSIVIANHTPATAQVDCYDTCYPYKSMGYYAEKQQCYCNTTIELRSVK